MLTNKRINLGIFIASVILRYFIIFYLAITLAHCIWWLFSPNINEVYVELGDPDKSDKATNYIVNRYPFGVIVIPKAAEVQKPRIIDKLKLTGVYLGGSSDSIAFIDYESKPIIVRQGQAIGTSDAIVKMINDDSIVVNEAGNEAVLKITYVVQPAPNGQSPSVNNVFNSSNNSVTPPYQPNNDLRERRRKLLDEFNHQRDQINQNAEQVNNGRNIDNNRSVDNTTDSNQ